MQGFSYTLCLFYLKCLDCKTCYKMTTFFPVAPITFIKSSRLCSSVEMPAVNSNLNQVTQKPKSKQKRKTGKKTRIPTNLSSLVNYIDSKKSLRCRKEIIISAFHEKEKGVYLMDENVAKDISILLAPELKDGNSPVIEANPGLGFLTDNLLNTGVPYMQLIESNKMFFDYLTKKEFPKHVDIYQNDILKIWKLLFLDKQDDGKRLKSLFSKVPSKDWTDEPAMKIVSAIPDKKFVYNIIENIISHTGFVQFGRPQFFLVIDPLSYYALTSKGYPDYRVYQPNSVLFQVIFDSQIMTKVPCTAVLPGIKMNVSLSPTQKKIMKEDGNFLYVIKLTPRRDLYSNNFDVHLPIFQFFLRQLCSARKNRIIPCIEQWSPGYGPWLISKGINVYTEVGELEPKVLLSIFLDFISREETKDDSAFLTNMESIMLKKELQK